MDTWPTFGADAVFIFLVPYLLYFLGTLFTVAFAFPLFWLLDTKSPQTVVAAVIIALSLGHGTMFGIQSAYFPELFGTRTRYTGASFGFQLSAATGRGLSPIIATVLADYMGGTAGVSLVLILLAMVTFIGTLFARKTNERAAAALIEWTTKCNRMTYNPLTSRRATQVTKEEGGSCF